MKTDEPRVKKLQMKNRTPMTQNLKNQSTANTPETTGNGVENLRNPNENLTSRKWLLYLVGSADPLLGFVHAHSEAEALDWLEHLAQTRSAAI